jgi:hypothetical protein
MISGRSDTDNPRKLLGPKLVELGFEEEDINAIVDVTGPSDGMPGFTSSDLAAADPDDGSRRLSGAADPATRALMLAEEMIATPPFQDKRSSR